MVLFLGNGINQVNSIDEKRILSKQSKSSRDWSFRIQDILKAILKIEEYFWSLTLYYSNSFQNNPFPSFLNLDQCS